jgi:hypothetical protein
LLSRDNLKLDKLVAGKIFSFTAESEYIIELNGLGSDLISLLMDRMAMGKQFFL